MVIENEVLTGCAMLGLRTSSIVRVNVSRGFMRGEVERDIGRLGDWERGLIRDPGGPVAVEEV